MIDSHQDRSQADKNTVLAFNLLLEWIVQYIIIIIIVL